VNGCSSMFGRELAPGAHQIGPTRRALRKGGFSRCYLFEDDDGTLTLVDTGWDDDAGVILRYLDDIGRSPTEIAYIAMTHYHRSHLGGLAELVKYSGAEVSSHETEAPVIDGRRRAHPIALWPLRPFRLIPFRIISWLPIYKHVPCHVDRYLVEGARVGPLEVLHTPGHTPGHLAFRYRDSVIVAGDAVATWPRFSAGWPGFNLDDDEYRVSLVRLVGYEPDVVCPGHGDAIVEGTAARLQTLVRGRKFKGARAKA
jgi:glyoxylase-like metal-dependent hydrolase (beta-lactamase superfamily II)